MNVFELDRTYVAGTYSRHPVQLVGGKGACLVDVDGKEYIDLGSGIAVNVFGACDEKWQAAVTAQIGKLQHASNLFYTEPCARLAEMLCGRTGMKKVFFSNSGAESNECAIKAARRWAALKWGEEVRPVIVTLKNSFHGRTLATISATGQDSFHKDFGPFLPGFVHADPATPGDLTRMVKENPCCAVMIECVQGEGGVLPLRAEFVEEIKKVVAENDVLLIVDEVQTGNGRSGALYAYMNLGLEPDIVTTAKGIGGGLPLGATMLGERAKDAFAPGTHGSTFGGNPVSCAGGLSIIARLDEELFAGVREKSAYIVRELTGAKGVKAVTGMGLMLGIECEREAKDVVADCRADGVLVLTAKTKIRLLPPLNITMQQLEKAVKVLKEALAK